MADYDIKKFQYVQGPDNEYHEFPIDMPSDQIDAEMADRYKDYKPEDAVPDVPIQPVPQDDWRQKEAASALEAVSPTVVPAEAGIVGEQRGTLLPISRSYVTDEGGKKVFNGDYSFALPGFIHDLPEQIDTVGSHPFGSEYSDDEINSIYGLAGFGVGGDLIHGTARGGAAVPKNYMMDDLKSTIKTRQALEDTPKAKIFREEALKTLDSPTGYGKFLRQSEREKGTQIVQRGAGAIRKSIENAANKKPTGLGIDPVSLIAPSMMSSISPGAAKAYAGARIAAGVLSKTKSGVAKGVNSWLLSKDMKDLGKVLDLGKKGRIISKGQAQVEATRRDFENHPGSAPRTGRPPTNEELLNTGPSSAVPPRQPVSPISLANPSGQIHMEIGDPIKKTIGTDPRAAAARQEAARNMPGPIDARIRPAAVPVVESDMITKLRKAYGRPAEPAEERFGPRTTTSPVPKAIDPELQKTVQDYISEGGNVTTPLPKNARPPVTEVRGPAQSTPDPVLAKAKTETRLGKLKREIELAKGDMERADYAPNNAMRAEEKANAQKRIDYYTAEIEKLKGGDPAPSKAPVSVISDAESTAITKIPEASRTSLQRLDQAKKALDVERKYGEGDWSKNKQSELKAEIAKLETEVAKMPIAEVKAYQDAAAARAAEAAKPREGPEGILAKQKEEVAADNAAKAAAEEAKRKETAARNAAAAKEPKTTAKAPRVKIAEPELPPAQYEPATIKNAKGITLPTVKKVEAPPPPQAKGTPTTGRVKKQKGQSPTKVKKAETTQKEARAAKIANEEPYVADKTDYRFGPAIIRGGEIDGSVDTFLRDFMERQRMNPDAAVSPLAEALKNLVEKPKPKKKK
jgi:hypothetical protein